jgi:hypothetical protein
VEIAEASRPSEAKKLRRLIAKILLKCERGSRRAARPCRQGESQSREITLTKLDGGESPRWG